MEFLSHDGVVTGQMKQKIQQIDSIKRKTSDVNHDIEHLKRDIKDIKAKQLAANAALDKELQHRRNVLKRRCRRRRELALKLEKLKVSM